MARQSRSHRTTTGSPTRDLFLAGIGAVSLGRKQVTQTAQQAADGLGSFRARAEAFVQDAESQASRWQKKAITLATEARVQAESRLAPVLSRLGIAAAPKKVRAARKPAGKRAVRRTRRAA